MSLNILSISESDVKGLRGIQADAKTTTALGGQHFSVPTFCFDNNNVEKIVSPVPKEIIQGKLKRVMPNCNVSAIKIGSLFNEEVLDSVVNYITEFKNIPIITDPNFITRCGTKIFDNSMIAAYKRRVLLLSDVLVLNVKEAEILTGMNINDISDMSSATSLIRTMGVDNVILKAGEAFSNKIVYFLASEEKETLYKRDKLEGRGTIGSSSLLSGNIAMSMAKGIDILSALEESINIVYRAIINSKYKNPNEGWVNLECINTTNSNNNSIVEEIAYEMKVAE